MVRDTLDAEGDGWSYVWTAAALRCAIRHAVPILGRGGFTPHAIRHFRSLIPIAEKRDAQREAVERRYGYDTLADAAQAARVAEEEAGALIVELPAATLAGIRVKLRYADDYLANRMSRERQTMMPAPFKAVHEAVRRFAQVQA